MMIKKMSFFGSFLDRLGCGVDLQIVIFYSK